MKNILLVDDDQVSNFITSKTLQMIGLADGIHTATNGKEALNLINDYFSGAQSLPDVIFLDLNMPVMDGFAFIEAFKKLQIPDKDSVLIAIVTSSQDPHDVRHAQKLGVTHYLTKPVTENDIRSVLEAAGALNLN